jgi:hypothetical protein
MAQLFWNIGKTSLPKQTSGILSITGLCVQEEIQKRAAREKISTGKGFILANFIN